MNFVGFLSGFARFSFRVFLGVAVFTRFTEFHWDFHSFLSSIAIFFTFFLLDLKFYRVLLGALRFPLIVAQFFLVLPFFNWFYSYFSFDYVLTRSYEVFSCLIVFFSFFFHFFPSHSGVDDNEQLEQDENPVHDWLINVFNEIELVIGDSNRSKMRQTKKTPLLLSSSSLVFDRSMYDFRKSFRTLCPWSLRRSYFEDERIHLLHFIFIDLKKNTKRLEEKLMNCRLVVDQREIWSAPYDESAVVFFSYLFSFFFVRVCACVRFISSKFGRHSVGRNDGGVYL